METLTPRKRMPVSALTDPKIVIPAIGAAFAKLNPRVLMKNPVMFVVEVVAALTTVIFLRDLATGGENLGFTFQIVVWLWVTVLFANFAEAVAEGRGKAQADSLRRTRTETQAKLLTGADRTKYKMVPGTSLKVGDIVLVEAGDIIPSDGEVIYGGVGSGLYGILLYAILAVFIAGLMVGRTPEYLGKKIEAKEVKMAILAIVVLPLCILGFMAVATVTPFGLSSIQDPGPHGFSEIMYLYSSQTGNNGSAFAGFTGNTLWYNTTGGLAMLIGRYFVIIPAMAIAGSLVAKKTVPASAGTFPTTGGLFVGLLVGVILIIGGLTFFPALALGPVVEHLAMQEHMLF